MFDVFVFILDNLSPQKKLRGGVQFVKEITLISISKVDRKALRKWVTKEFATKVDQYI